MKKPNLIPHFKSNPTKVNLSRGITSYNLADISENEAKNKSEVFYKSWKIYQENKILQSILNKVD